MKRVRKENLGRFFLLHVFYVDTVSTLFLLHLRALNFTVHLLIRSVFSHLAIFLVYFRRVHAVILEVKICNGSFSNSNNLSLFRGLKSWAKSNIFHKRHLASEALPSTNVFTPFLWHGFFWSWYFQNACQNWHTSFTARNSILLAASFFPPSSQWIYDAACNRLSYVTKICRSCEDVVTLWQLSVKRWAPWHYSQWTGHPRTLSIAMCLLTPLGLCR